MPNQINFNSNELDNLVDSQLITGDGAASEGDSLYSEDSLSSTTQKDEGVDNYGDDNYHDDTSESSNSDYMTQFLENYGIKSGKITYEKDDGETEEVDFNDLDTDEKLNILKELTSPNLSNEEIKVINYLRSNNATMQDVIDYYSQKAVADYIEKNGEIEKHYSVDEYSDDALYLADLKSKYEDMTEEEMKSDLESAKENPDLFKKKVDNIRKQYKAKEEQEAKDLETQRENEYNEFRTSLEDELSKFNSVSIDYKDNDSDSLIIDNDIKENILHYLLDQDETGATQFTKDLLDPKKLINFGWFANYGKEAFSDITNYWKSKLKDKRNPDNTVTTRVPRDVSSKKDAFLNRYKTVEVNYDENLL